MLFVAMLGQLKAIRNHFKSSINAIINAIINNYKQLWTINKQLDQIEQLDQLAFFDDTCACMDLNKY